MTKITLLFIFSSFYFIDIHAQNYDLHLQSNKGIGIDIGTTNPSAMLRIEELFVGSLLLDGNQIQRVNTGGVPGTLYLNNKGGSIQLGSFILSTPTRVDIRGSSDSGNNNTYGDSHAARIEDNVSINSGVLALKLGDKTPTGADNWITFYDGGGNDEGAVEAISGGGVNYKTGAADFAEYIPKANSSRDYNAAEIVGLKEGKIYDAAKHDIDQFMVVSTTPAFTGNSPGKGEEVNYEILGFMGQVQVNVRGPVKSGDFILASVNGDGTGIAKSASNIRIEEMHRVVGRAWETSNEIRLKEVTAAVGLDQTSLIIPTLKRLENENRELRNQVEYLANKLERLEGKIE